MATDKDLANTLELFLFLQGMVPSGYNIPEERAPKLTADQAWTVIWYLGNKYWQVRDCIERCCVCGEIYDSERGGQCLDFGAAPYHFCDGCDEGAEYREKIMTAEGVDYAVANFGYDPRSE